MFELTILPVDDDPHVDGEVRSQYSFFRDTFWGDYGSGSNYESRSLIALPEMVKDLYNNSR